MLYEQPLPSSRIPNEIRFPRTLDGCVAAAIVFCVSSTDEKLPTLVSMDDSEAGCRQPWSANPEPDFSSTALLDARFHASAQWWFSIDGSDDMDKILQGEH